MKYIHSGIPGLHSRVIPPELGRDLYCVKKTFSFRLEILNFKESVRRDDAPSLFGCLQSHFALRDILGPLKLF